MMRQRDYEDGRRLIARVAGLLYERRLTELVGGNMSLRVGDTVVMTPTKASEETGWRLAAEDTLVQRLDGELLVGEASRISREIGIHMRLYRTFPEVGCVFHLHLPEAIAAAEARWQPGVVAATTDPHGAAVVVLERHLRAQTEPHDARAVELLGEVERADGAVAIGSMHGTFGVARDLPTNVRAADVLRQRLEADRLCARLRGLRAWGVS
jgi:ribulose-5-phosphate 4-epimerase/fuculose-1-phosphate aldolase